MSPVRKQMQRSRILATVVDRSREKSVLRLASTMYLHLWFDFAAVQQTQQRDTVLLSLYAYE